MVKLHDIGLLISLEVIARFPFSRWRLPPSWIISRPHICMRSAVRILLKDFMRISLLLWYCRFSTFNMAAFAKRWIFENGAFDSISVDRDLLTIFYEGESVILKVRADFLFP
jgi:hypothetical protein